MPLWRITDGAWRLTSYIHRHVHDSLGLACPVRSAVLHNSSHMLKAGSCACILAGWPTNGGMVLAALLPKPGPIFALPRSCLGSISSLHKRLIHRGAFLGQIATEEEMQDLGSQPQAYRLNCPQLTRLVSHASGVVRRATRCWQSVYMRCHIVAVHNRVFTFLGATT